MALKKISNESPEIFEKLEVVLVGAGNEYGGYGAQKLKELIDKYNLAQTVKITPVVPYKESLKLMKESDCLVVIDAPFEKSPFFPSKAVEYAEANVLSTTKEHSVLFDVLIVKEKVYQEKNKEMKKLVKIIDLGIREFMDHKKYNKRFGYKN